ncbi:MAG: hypothetical protein R3301_12310, partial [Saprospiraceae bacterium]|nr:hypothetical protein [Saprospiraceae bacterium]
MKIRSIHSQGATQRQLYGDFTYVPNLVWLKPAVDLWLSERGPDHPAYVEILGYLESNPGLLEIIEDFEMLRDHGEFLERLLDPVFPHAEWVGTIAAVCPPFSSTPWVLATEQYQSLIGDQGNDFDLTQPLVGKQSLDRRLIYAYKAVLKRFYDVDMSVDEPVIARLHNEKTGLKRYFKLNGNSRLVDITTRTPLKAMESGQLERLLEQPFDQEEWFNVLPIDQFLFRGLSIVSLVDVTIEEATNRLQYLLLSKDAEDETAWMAAILEEVRTVFRQPDLRLGLATLQRDGRLNETSDRPLWNSLLLREMSSTKDLRLEDTPYIAVLSGQ